MDVDIRRDGQRYTLPLREGGERGRPAQGALRQKGTGTLIKWKPDLQVFTDIDVSLDYYLDILKRQAVVNAGVTFHLKNETAPGKFETTDLLLRKRHPGPRQGAGRGDSLTPVQFWQSEKKVKDREDMPLYNVKINGRRPSPTGCTRPSTTTTPAGWSTAAPRTRRCATPLCTRSTPG